MQRLVRLLHPSLVLSAALAAAAPASADLACGDVPQLVREYLKSHVEHRLLTPDLEDRAIRAHLRRLDPSHTLFLDSELEEQRLTLAGIIQEMQRGDCTALTSLHESVVERHRRSAQLVRKVVNEDDFELDRSVELVLDPEERGRPSTQKERKAVMRKLIQFQLANYLTAGETLDDSKEKLVHRYDLIADRAADGDAGDVHSAFLDSFASALDPHSSYLSEDVLEDFRIQMSLSLEGIGVALSERDGYAVVERIIRGGAASRLERGLERGDKIITVAEASGEPVNIVDMPLRKAVSLIRGKAGTEVQLTLLRQGEDGSYERIPVTIERDKIDLEEQAARLEFVEREVAGKKLKLAVIELPSFYGDANPTSRQCTDDLTRLLAQVKAEKTDGLLLDLSANGGGLLEHAVKISGLFLRKGEIVGIENARGQRKVLSDHDEDILYSGPLVVHTSRVSASASEILAGALKDYKRAVIAGDDHTFGKGTVQTVTDPPAVPGALKITTALFYRPGGRSTQNDGVEADVVIPSRLATDEVGERSHENALSSKRVEPFMGSYANAIHPDDRWSTVNDAVLAELRRRSLKRVGGSEAFDEIREQLTKMNERESVVRLADFLKEREEAEAKRTAAKDATTTTVESETAAVQPGAGDASIRPAKESETLEKDGEEKRDALSPQAEEALNVLVDLVVLSHAESRGPWHSADGR